VGDLGEFFKVYGFAPADDSASLVKVCSDYRGDVDYYESQFHPTNLLSQLVPFSSTYGGDLICWDAGHDRGGEYPIFGLPRPGGTVMPVTSNFPDFVRGVFDTSTMKALGFTDPSPCPQTFEPWCRPIV
jgi:hypothetical protein